MRLRTLSPGTPSIVIRDIEGLGIVGPCTIQPGNLHPARRTSADGAVHERNVAASHDFLHPNATGVRVDKVERVGVGVGVEVVLASTVLLLFHLKNWQREESQSWCTLAGNTSGHLPVRCWSERSG